LVALRNLALLVGRVFIASIFVYEATGVVRIQAEIAAYMKGYGVPGSLLWPYVLFMFIGGLMIVAGFLTRIIAIGFAGFCVLTALIFHHHFTDLNQVLHFGKDFGLTGGFLFLAAGGAGAWSLDARLRTDCWPLSQVG
jgi:putative oxidoreductase